MSAAVYTLADLLSGENLDLIRARLLATLQGAGFPAMTEWLPKGGVEMSFVDMVGESTADLLAADLPQIVAGGFLGRGTGLWLDLLAEKVYGLARVGATKTSFNMELVVAATAQPYTWDVGDVEIVAPSGNRYRSTTAATGQPGSFATLAVEAEAAGAAYNDDPALMALVTTFAGVTLRPAAPAFSDVVHAGASTGQIAASVLLGDTAPVGSFAVRIDASGDVGAARASISADGGPFDSVGILFRGTFYRPGFGGFKLTALNGSGTPSSFVAGDVFAFTAPGGPGLVLGSDAESDAHLAGRCRARWPSLSLTPTNGLFELWAILACPTASRIQVSPDLASDPTAIPGRVRMSVADSRQPMDQNGLAKINAYITPKLGVLDSFLATGATALPIVPTGSVLVTPTSLEAVQQAAEVAWSAYLGTVPIGGVVELARLQQVLMDAGAVDVATTTALNGGAGNVYLAPGQIPIESGTLITSLDWTF